MKNSAKMRLAYQKRAGMIGELGICCCGFPVDKHATSTGHDERCPTHGMIELRTRREATEDLEAAAAELAMPPAMGPDLLRGYASQWNEIADVAFKLSQMMKDDDLSSSLAEEARAASNNARSIAFRLDEQAHHLEQIK